MSDLQLSTDDVIKVIPADYKLDSQIDDVLRLQICKSQPTREEMVSCITQQQEYLSKLRDQMNFWGTVLIVIAIVVIVILAYKLWRTD